MPPVYLYHITSSSYPHHRTHATIRHIPRHNKRLCFSCHYSSRRRRRSGPHRTHKMARTDRPEIQTVSSKSWEGGRADACVADYAEPCAAFVWLAFVVRTVESRVAWLILCIYRHTDRVEQIYHTCVWARPQSVCIIVCGVVSSHWPQRRYE